MKTNTVLYGDCLRVFPVFPDECVDLIYIDPPFFTQRKHRIGEVGFDDVFSSMNDYLEFMRERLVELHRVLKKTGGIYLHCDWRTSHRLRCLLDDVFGENNFANEIIWHYKTSSGSCSNKLIPNHDILYNYTKDYKSQFIFNEQREPWPEKTLKKWQKDEKGIYRLNGKKKYYVDSRGKKIDDVWYYTLSSRSKERIGYPTQKPLALLERIIKVSSNEGDIVLDAFCGSGTTLHAAHNLGRKWIGIDENPDAVEIAYNRMVDAGAI